MNEMKIDKSKNYCFLGDKEESFQAVIKIIPIEVIEEINSKSLGKLIDSIWKSWQETKRIHEADIITEGAIWDEKSQKMIELCQN